MNIGHTLLAAALLPLLAACAPANSTEKSISVLALMQGAWPTMDNCTVLTGSASGLYNSMFTKSSVFGRHVINDITLSSDTTCSTPEVSYREVFELVLGNEGPNKYGNEVDWVLVRASITPITVLAAANLFSTSKCGSQSWFAGIEHEVLYTSACNLDDSTSPRAVGHAPFVQRELISVEFIGGTTQVFMGQPTGDPLVRPTAYAASPTLWR